MVHLTRVNTGLDQAQAGSSANAGAGADKNNSSTEVIAEKTARLQLAEYADEFTTSVYGSRFAREDLPKSRIPEAQMPREVAYRMIKDQLSLDGNPKLK